MKMNKKIRLAALATAAAFICSSTGYYSYTIFEKKHDITAENSNGIIRDISAEIVPADQKDPVVEQLANACRQNNKEEITVLCDTLRSEMDASRDAIIANSADINAWGSDVIKNRQKEYENEMNVKYSQTAEALEEIKNGIDTQENLEIVSCNFSVPEEYHRSDAAPNTQDSAENVEFIEDDKAVAAYCFTSPAPTADDLKYDVNAEMPKALSLLADTYPDANSLYLFVKNCIKNEVYTGSKKGAIATLSQLGGNDIDQAALLIALLRANGIPARFVGGNIRITAEQAIELTGASDASTAGRFLATAYRNVKGITSNGTITGYKLYHTWVEAYLPYTDYRGAGNNAGESVWVQLDPSFKKLESKSGTLDAEYNADSAALIGMINESSEKGAEYSPAKVDMPDKLTYYYQDIAQTNDEYIPASLPYSVLSVDERYSFIKDSDKDRISITINDETLLSAPVAELYGQSVIISYEPATEYDKEVMDRYEKLTDVPAYIVNVVPVITVGSKKYRGSWEGTLGSMQQMTTAITNSSGTSMLYDSVFCGSMYAVNLDLQSIAPDEAKAAKLRMNAANNNYDVKNMCTPEELGAFLDYAGKYYFSLCDYQASIYSSTMNISHNRRLGLAFTGYQFTKTTMFGMTKSLDYGAFYIDVAYNSSADISFCGNRDAEKNYAYTLGSVESYYEGYIWEKTVDSEEPGISTISVMKAAADKGIDFRYLTKTNAEEQLSKCNITESVKNEIRNFVNQGLLVELVPETLVIGDWNGTAYTAIDLNSGSASYMISGGTAGGSSMTYDDLFSPRQLREVTPEIRKMLPSIDFEDLFCFNNTLFLVNYELGATSLMKGYFDLVSAEVTADGMGMLTSACGMIGSAFSIGAAMNMRYKNYDFIFKYAEQGEDCMDEYLFFTMRCILDTIVNTITFLSQFGGKYDSIKASFYNSVYYAKWLAYDIEEAGRNNEPAVTTENIYSGMAILWNVLGIALALV